MFWLHLLIRVLRLPFHLFHANIFFIDQHMNVMQWCLTSAATLIYILIKLILASTRINLELILLLISDVISKSFSLDNASKGIKGYTV